MLITTILAPASTPPVVPTSNEFELEEGCIVITVTVFPLLNDVAIPSVVEGPGDGNDVTIPSVVNGSRDDVTLFPCIVCSYSIIVYTLK